MTLCSPKLSDWKSGLLSPTIGMTLVLALLVLGTAGQAMGQDGPDDRNKRVRREAGRLQEGNPPTSNLNRPDKSAMQDLTPEQRRAMRQRLAANRMSANGGSPTGPQANKAKPKPGAQARNSQPEKSPTQTESANMRRKGSSAGSNDDPWRQRMQELRKRLAAADVNGDQKLSRDEAPGMLKERFEQVDTDADGLIDVRELSVAMQKLKQRMEEQPEMMEAIKNKLRQPREDRDQPVDGRPVKPIRPGQLK